jgi:CYTH domain-containing protein
MKTGPRPSRFARPERERRFLVDARAAPTAARSSRIDDLYVAGTRLRLRRVERDDGTVEHKLTQKLPGDPWDQLTTMYLAASEHERLSSTLPGARLVKTRRHAPELVYDVFEGPLAGLVIAEIEFDEDAPALAYRPPEGHVEITADPRFTGAELAWGDPESTLRAAEETRDGAGA